MSRFAASMLIAVVGLLMAGPVAAQNVLTPDTESLYRCTHTWTDADGNIFGFRLSECGLDFYDFEANPDKASINVIVPDILLLDGEELKVTTISSVFYNCKALVTLTLPSTVFYVSYMAFKGCSNLTDIYCQALQPPFVTDKNATQVNHDPFTARLHVPACAVENYTNALFWGDFPEITALSDDVHGVSFYRDYTVTDLTGIATDTELCLNYNDGDKVGFKHNNGAHVDVNTPAPWQIGNFLMVQTTEYRYYDAGHGVSQYVYEPKGFTTTLIPQSKITATGDVTLKLDCRNMGWKFFSLPFDVYMGDVSVSHNASWVIRRFSARERSVLGDTWQNVGPRDTLRANTGYIIYTMTPNNEEIPILTVKAANNAKKQSLFATGDVTVPLVQTDAVVPQDRNWNFIGNPYPTFYDMSKSDFTAPYTVWSRKVMTPIYEVYSPLDDDYVLQPNDAFFVQCPVDVNSINFQAAGRMHTSTVSPASSAPRRARALQNRQLYNIFLSAGEFSDRARIVVNPEAREGYELERDASKMMATGVAVPQIYVIDGGINYAIDERPLGSGQFTLGTSFANAGEYALRLETRGETQTAILTDRLTGETFDLTQGESYTFFAEAGTANDRFTLTIGDDATAIDAVDNGQMVNGKWYNLNGQRVSRPANGIYVKQGKKYIIK